MGHRIELGHQARTYTIQMAEQHTFIRTGVTLTCRMAEQGESHQTVVRWTCQTALTRTSLDMIFIGRAKRVLPCLLPFSCHMPKNRKRNLKPNKITQLA